MVKPRDEFVGLLAAAADNAEMVAMILRQRGFSVRVLPHSVSPNVQERWKHVDEGDLEINSNGTVERIELKHWPSVNFHSLESVPYQNVIVDEAYKIEKDHRYLLHAYFILNASRTGCLVIPASTRPHWFKKSAVDGRENDGRLYYFCPKQFLSYEKFAESAKTEAVSNSRLNLKLAPGAYCGSMACAGCYDVGDGKQIHSPRPGYDQEKLSELDGCAT